MINFKKLCLLFFVGVVSPAVFAQSYTSDWKAFETPKNWVMIIKKDSTRNFNRKIIGSVGKLMFKNALDNELEIGYEIFNDFEADSLFKQRIYRQRVLMSCTTNTTFKDFNFKGYYYLPFACNTCLTNRVGANTVNIKNDEGKLMTNCDYLNNRILKFVTSKP